MQLFNSWQGLLLLAAFGLLSYGLTVAMVRGKEARATRTAFLVADRDVGWVKNAFSIAATWIWAPALFVAAEQGYKNGWVGVFWFTAPNVACLVIFSAFAAIMRRKYPEGFTLSGFMRDNYSRRVQRVYLGTLGSLAIASFAVQLLAGGLVVSVLTGINFLWVTLILAFIAISYSLRSGLAGSIVTDYAQMILIAVVGLVLAPWVVLQAGGDLTLAGMGGVGGLTTSLISGPGAAVFWSFGLSTSIGLLSGPFGDQSFWQRTFAARTPRDARRSFLLGAGIFAIVPITMSLLGFAVAGAGIVLENTQLTNLTAITNWLPTWTVIPFLFFILSGLVSTLDSNLASFGSLAGADLAPDKMGHRSDVAMARRAMVILALVGVLLANLPGLTITALFIFYGTIRATTLLPTVMALLRPQAERGMFYGTLAAAVIGLPISAYGNLLNIWQAKVAGSLLVLALSGGLVWLFTHLQNRRESGVHLHWETWPTGQWISEAPDLGHRGTNLAEDGRNPLLRHHGVPPVEHVSRETPIPGTTLNLGVTQRFGETPKYDEYGRVPDSFTVFKLPASEHTPAELNGQTADLHAILQRDRYLDYIARCQREGTPVAEQFTYDEFRKAEDL